MHNPSKVSDQKEEVIVNNNAAGIVSNDVTNFDYRTIIVIIITIFLINLAVHFIKKYFSKGSN